MKIHTDIQLGDSKEVLKMFFSPLNSFKVELGEKFSAR